MTYDLKFSVFINLISSAVSTTPKENQSLVLFKMWPYFGLVLVLFTKCISGAHTSCTSITHTIGTSPTEAELDRQFSLICQAEVLSSSVLSIKNQTWYLGDRVPLEKASVNAKEVGKNITEKISSSTVLFNKVS